MISPAEIKELLDYAPDTGVFVWRLRTPDCRNNRHFNSCFAGKIAGCCGSHGYWHIRVHRKLYLAHRVAYAIMTGQWPEDEIDHINGVLVDNRWINLRPATHQQNMMNMKYREGKRTKGIYDHPSGMFQAEIRANGKRISLGYFWDREQAIAVRKAAEMRLHGEYRRLS